MGLKSLLPLRANCGQTRNTIPITSLIHCHAVYQRIASHIPPFTLIFRVPNHHKSKHIRQPFHPTQSCT
jgi:hypothetical protein